LSHDCGETRLTPAALAKITWVIRTFGESVAKILVIKIVMGPHTFSGASAGPCFETKTFGQNIVTKTDDEPKFTASQMSDQLRSRALAPRLSRPAARFELLIFVNENRCSHPYEFFGDPAYRKFSGDCSWNPSYRSSTRTTAGSAARTATGDGGFSRATLSRGPLPTIMVSAAK
jgi:hypothetical protein